MSLQWANLEQNVRFEPQSPSKNHVAILSASHAEMHKQENDHNPSKNACTFCWWLNLFRWFLILIDIPYIDITCAYTVYIHLSFIYIYIYISTSYMPPPTHPPTPPRIGFGFRQESSSLGPSYVWRALNLDLSGQHLGGPVGEVMMIIFINHHDPLIILR